MEVSKGVAGGTRKHKGAECGWVEGNALDPTTLRAAPVHSRPGVHAVVRSRKESGRLEMLASSAHKKWRVDLDMSNPWQNVLGT